MKAVDSFIQNDIIPLGIISFEFIKTIEAADAVREIWGDTGLAAAGISLGLDFLYIPLYSVIIFILLQITSGKSSRCKS